MNRAVREMLEERRRFLLTGVRGFIGPLPRPIGLLEDTVREGRRAWALPSPFQDPLYGRDIVSLFCMTYLPQYPVGHVGTLDVLGEKVFDLAVLLNKRCCGAASSIGGFWRDVRGL